jgi:hypothetical protein
MYVLHNITGKVIIYLSNSHNTLTSSHTPIINIIGTP